LRAIRLPSRSQNSSFSGSQRSIQRPLRRNMAATLGLPRPPLYDSG
jgi:hypothetical protein